jgi:predicted N-acetyltransferase YhbS
MTDPVLRVAGPEDDEAVAALIGEAFPGNPKARLDVLRWQYRDNPFGSTVSRVWDDGGRIVAHYSAFPMPYLLDGSGARAGNAVDAAVAPSHQGRRLFTPLAQALYDGCAEAGLPVAVCYASNPIAMQGVARAGVVWQPRLRTLVLAVDDAWLGRRFHVPGAVGGVVRRVAFGLGSGPAGEDVDALPDGIDGLWSAVVRAGGIGNGVDRGEAWCRWRYGTSPLGPYRYVTVRRGGILAALAVVVVRQDFGGRFAYLLELQARDTDAARSALRAVAATDGISGVATVAVDGGPLHRLAADAGMRTLPRRLEPKGGAWYGLVDTTGGGRSLAAPWHVGWGDMDHL